MARAEGAVLQVAGLFENRVYMIVDLIAPHTGQPAITVPMGFTQAGLPLGLQLLARPFDEHNLFQYAYAYEQATRHRRPPKAFGRLPYGAP